MLKMYTDDVSERVVDSGHNIGSASEMVNYNAHATDGGWYFVKVKGQDLYNAVSPGFTRWGRLGYAAAGRGFCIGRSGAESRLKKYVSEYSDYSEDDLEIVRIPLDKLNQALSLEFRYSTEAREYHEAMAAEWRKQNGHVGYGYEYGTGRRIDDVPSDTGSDGPYGSGSSAQVAD